jgi:alkylhydroperoxidase/carboxymuconolactone decarboxylase family protein YurZ
MDEEEAAVIEAITHLAFYLGWPDRNGRIIVAKELFSRPEKEVSA